MLSTAGAVPIAFGHWFTWLSGHLAMTKCNDQITK
jgi:hypothetical protein